MKPQEFKSRYGCTLQTDPETKQHYIKLPVTDFNQLAYMQESLLEGILLLTQLEERHYKREQLQSVMYWLCKLVLLTYPHDELEGLSKWLESE
ncbi:hypothetical protein [Seonamhaeicola sp.]|uniref:hypothetical protein n=1 Tax=Seonamhaeicola sp. TaxID=1912245 RepID=UPI002624F4F0|nr:hypothetical protein [Seonamhaeicola sp.]